MFFSPINLRYLRSFPCKQRLCLLTDKSPRNCRQLDRAAYFSLLDKVRKSLRNAPGGLGGCRGWAGRGGWGGARKEQERKNRKYSATRPEQEGAARGVCLRCQSTSEEKRPFSFLVLLSWGIHLSGGKQVPQLNLSLLFPWTL